MGDAENALQPSKKRAAGRELTRDTPIDDEEDSPDLESGTFNRASDEVLASRRIVKVRRQQTTSAPSSNPFAGIRLVPSSGSTANPADESKGSDDTDKGSEKAKDEDTKQSESKTDEAGVGDNPTANKDAAKGSKTDEAGVGDNPTANKDAAKGSNADEEHAAEKENTGIEPEVDKEKSKEVGKSENENKDAAGKESASEVDEGQTKDHNDSENIDKKENTEGGDKKDYKAESAEPSAEGGNLKSFQLLSSNQNAFTGVAGTGFSTTSFSFGTSSNDGSSSIFAMKNDKPFGLGLTNNGSSVFGASSAAKSEGNGLAMQEVAVETGEENEKVVFNADSVLFEFVDGSLKERGKGELKVNVTSGSEKARILMRSRGNLRLIMNARLYADMKLTNMDKKGVTFACINSASEGKGGLSTFTVKFKDVSIVEEFKAAVMEHKDGTSTVLKTPENSPKASDE